MDRREFITGMSAASIATAIGSPLRSTLGAKGTQYAIAENGMKNPYVTDGLINMWDGEWNVGLGAHDENAAEWKDLITGTNNWLISEHGSWEEKGLRSDGLGYAASGVAMASFMTAECCFTNFSRGTETCILATGKDGFNEMQYFYQTMENKLIRYSVGRPYCFSYDADSSLMSTMSFENTTLKGKGAYAAYFNGIKIDSFTYGGYMYAGSGTPTIFGRIGGDRNMVGIMHSIRVYSRQLSDEEISANYAVDVERFGL